MRKILFASLVGTTIEYYDFYIYAAAAVLVFPQLFFPSADATAATLQSLATFGLAFLARPVGSALFGHFGDRVGRKATLVASLLTMGLCTVAIGLLPTYATLGIAAPLLLALCRFGQGLGLGGEWGGAVLLATEHAPQARRAWYGMFPQLGAPLGFLCSTGAFLLLSERLSDDELLSYGWRIPFLASALLVLVGLYVRLRLSETPAFRQALENQERVRVPMLTVCLAHTRTLVLGTLAATATFAVFYVMTVFSLSWGTTALGYPRPQFLLLQMGGVLFFALTIPIAAGLAGRWGRRPAMIAATLGIIAFGLVFAPLFSSGSPWRVLVFLATGLALMGLSFGPLGTALAELFPTAIRYTGTSLTFNLAGILGASLAPYVATWLAARYGLAAVGYYISLAGVVTLLAWLLITPKHEGEWQASRNGPHQAVASAPRREPARGSTPRAVRSRHAHGRGSGRDRPAWSCRGSTPCRDRAAATRASSPRPCRSRPRGTHVGWESVRSA
jgi:metabolite-proton symporter